MNQVISRSSTWNFPLPPDEIPEEMQSSKRETFFWSFPLVSNRCNPLSTQKQFMMRITVDAASVTELRHIIVSTCGDPVLYMRVEPVDHATKMKVWLCLRKASIDSIIDNIMRALPQAEFGRISPLVPA
jgi:hypothetical protein